MEKHIVLNKIINWFYSDTVELLDLVLHDSNYDPQYSAITAYNRLELYLLATQSNEQVFDWLLKSGYTEQDIKLLESKIKKEDLIRQQI